MKRKLKCIMNGSTVTNFTDGKVYEEVSIQGNLVGVLDDSSVLRYILPNSLSGHLVKVEKVNVWPGEIQVVVGAFEEVYESI